MRRRVCIVSPGNLASNPRLVKEADALYEAGYDVTAVACDYTDALRPFDDRIIAGVPWSVRRVRRPRGSRYSNRAAVLLARALSTTGRSVPVSLAATAYGGPVSALRRATCAVPADLYIAHYVAALPAAAEAARRHGAMMAFDAEDFHSGEGTEGPFEKFRMKMAETVEAACIPRCAYVTAASPLIGKAYAARYGVMTTTVLNVFPLDMAVAAGGAETVQSGRSDTLSAYWFSQTIGLDRGLQPFLQAMSLAKTYVTLDVRGGNRWGHGDSLLALARDLGIADRVNLLPMASPDDMVRLAASYDLGLSLETDVTENRRLCLTNKIFTYLLAGVPTMMSDTPAQRALSADLGAAAVLVSLADPEGMARALDALAGSPDILEQAKATATRLGLARYNWGVEKNALIRAVASAFDRQDGNNAWRH